MVVPGFKLSSEDAQALAQTTKLKPPGHTQEQEHQTAPGDQRRGEGSAKAKVATSVPEHADANLDLGIHPDPDMDSSNKFLLTISKDQAPGVSAGRMGSCLCPFLPGSLACQMSLCHLTVSRGFSLSS